MPERRRQGRGRGLDAIFDTGDLSLDEAHSGEGNDHLQRRSSGREAQAEERPVSKKATPGQDEQSDEARGPSDSAGPAVDSAASGSSRVGDYAQEPQARGGGESRDHHARSAHLEHADPTTRQSEPPDPGNPRPPGRPAGSVGQSRTLLQKGFYLELEQDQMLDQIRSSLKSKGFTPDRSAIVRAAVESFYQLDPADQEEMVRRLK